MATVQGFNVQGFRVQGEDGNEETANLGKGEWNRTESSQLSVISNQGKK